MPHPRGFRLWIWGTFLMLGGLVGGLTAGDVLAAPKKTPLHDNVVISEFRSRGPNGPNDEFIEIFNPTNTIIPLGNWTIWFSDNTGSKTLIYTFPATFPDTSPLQLQPGQHFLVANNPGSSGYSGSITPDGIYGSGSPLDIPDDGGIGLVLPDGVTIVDQAGMSNNSSFYEGNFLPPLTSSGDPGDPGYERGPGGNAGNCTDTDNNNPDFKLITPAFEQNSSSELTTACIGNKADQTIQVGSHAPASADYNSGFTVTATASSGLPVEYSASGACTNTSGDFTITSGSGTCIVHYNQPGDANNYNAAPEVTETVTATKLPQAITITTSAPANAAYNSVFTVAATGGASGNPIDYSGTSGICTNSSGDFTMTSGTGICTVHYNQAGNDNYQAAAELTEPVNATKLPQTISINTGAPPNAAYNSSFTVAATSSSGLAVVYRGTNGICSNTSGTFTMTSGTGICTVHYNQPGDTNYDPAAEATESVTATKLSQTIAFSSPAPSNAMVNGPAYTPAAAATSGLTVQFTVDPPAASACSISAGMVSFHAVGTCVVNANQPGNANYIPAPQVQQSFQVGRGDQTITFTSPPPPSAAVNGPSYTPLAVAPSGLTVILTIDGSASTICSISAGVVSFQAAGTCVIDANQAGDTNFRPAPQVQQSFHVAAAAPTPTPTAPSHIVISEFRSRGPNGAGDEFVELFNPTGASVNVSSWMIRRSYSCGYSSMNLVSISANTILLPGQHYLVASTGSSVPNPDQTFTTDIPDDGGVGLLTNYAVVVDAAGMCETTQYHEGTALAPMVNDIDQSYERKPGGATSCYDTNNNANDFYVNSPSIPQNKNSPIVMCAGVSLYTPTPTPTPSPTRTPTRAPTPFPGIVVINEFLPHPHTDWNGDGTANSGDEYIELMNMGTEPVNLLNWKLDDDGGSSPFTLPSLTLLPRQMAVFYQSQTGISLSDGGDSVRLMKPTGLTVDRFNYPVVTVADRTWCRLPDGTGGWSFICNPTPAKPNIPVSLGNPGTAPPVESEPLCVMDTAPRSIISAECNSPGSDMWGDAGIREIWLKSRWKWDVFVQ